jgi:hypothetical protein
MATRTGGHAGTGSVHAASGGDEGVRRGAGVVGISFTVHLRGNFSFFVLALEIITGSDFSYDAV